jgi:hypothetical protein
MTCGKTAGQDAVAIANTYMGMRGRRMVESFCFREWTTTSTFSIEPNHWAESLPPISLEHKSGLVCDEEGVQEIKTSRSQPAWP